MSKSSGGKGVPPREMPLMMLFSNAEFVATAVGAYVRDLVVKVQEALQNQPSYLHVTVPCQVSWMYSPDHGVQISRKLVQTGMIPLWSCKNGVFKRTVKVPPDQRIPVAELLGLQRRYGHITEEGIEEIEEYIKEKNDRIDRLEEVFSKK